MKAMELKKGVEVCIDQDKARGERCRTKGLLDRADASLNFFRHSVYCGKFLGFKDFFLESSNMLWGYKRGF